MSRPINDNRALSARVAQTQHRRLSDKLWELSLCADWLHNELSRLSCENEQRYVTIETMAEKLASCLAIEFLLHNAEKEV